MGGGRQEQGHICYCHRSRYRAVFFYAMVGRAVVVSLVLLGKASHVCRFRWWLELLDTSDRTMLHGT